MGSRCTSTASSAPARPSYTRRCRPTPSARPGGELRVGITRPCSIDPAMAFDPMGMLVVRTMCDPLVGYHPVTGATVPGLAESWQVSENGGHVNIKLRKGVRFSDGSKV